MTVVSGQWSVNDKRNGNDDPHPALKGHPPPRGRGEEEQKRQKRGNMSRVNPKGEVWVYAEQEDGQLHEVSLELLSKGRQIADRLGVPLASCLLGHALGKLPQTLIEHGADKVYAADDKLLAHYQATSYAKVLAALVEERLRRSWCWGDGGGPGSGPAAGLDAEGGSDGGLYGPGNRRSH